MVNGSMRCPMCRRFTRLKAFQLDTERIVAIRHYLCSACGHGWTKEVGLSLGHRQHYGTSYLSFTFPIGKAV